MCTLDQALGKCSGLKAGFFEELWDGGLQSISVCKNLHCCHFTLIP